MTTASNGGVAKSQTAYDAKILGVISTSPGQTLGKKQNDDDVQLALNGRVPVKVSSINGDIHAGDELTSSSIPGVAMKATGVGQVIGKALEDYTATDTAAVGKVLVFMNLSWYDSQANWSISVTTMSLLMNWHLKMAYQNM